MRFQACTIIARNYLAQARVLFRSFRRFHPEARFTVLVFDAPRESFDEPFDILSLADVGLPAGEEARLPLIYNVTELATALKPWFLRALLSREQTPLLYFDADIEIFSPVDRLARLASEHTLLLTPHTTLPMSREGMRPNETDILSAGIYNLGFLGLHPDGEPLLSWWGQRLLREANIDVANMRFTDQRWMDFAPGYFDAHILKDETCNVAYWNADSRPLQWTGERYEVNGRPLCFFHYSGFEPEKPHLLSRYQGPNPRTRLSEQPALARLCREYTEKLMQAGYAEAHALPYGLAKTPDGLTITKPMRLVCRAALREHEETGARMPPSAFSDGPAFVSWLNEPLYRWRCPELTRYFWAIYRSRPDIRARFPNLPDGDHLGYYDWLQKVARYEIPIADELMPEPMLKETLPEKEATASPIRGVMLTGYLQAEVGTGESGRLMAVALEASGEKYATRVWTATPSRQDHPWKVDSGNGQPNYDTNLICINADQLPLFAQEVGPEFFRNRYNIGLWFWETELFPVSMHAGFDFLHEVWVTSEFVRKAIAAASPVPVFTMPLPLRVEVPLGQVPDRAALNLPEGFLFLFSFDFFSVAERKNAVAVIQAFQHAFDPGKGAVLLIKSINGHTNRAELERLHHARADRADVILRDGYLSRPENDALFAACDCYVSLHRSEGFGLTIAEAMLQEKPAIATRYSGNLEFMDDSNSFLCGYNLRRVGNDAPPYPPDAEWADPDVDEASRLMRFVREHPEEAQQRGRKARADLCARHHPGVAGAFIKKRLTELRQQAPRPVPFTAIPPERASITEVRTALEQEVNVRQTVPSLLTWIFQGPRRAMKKFLRMYDEHLRRIGLSTVAVCQEIDAEWLRERGALTRRVATQEYELERMKKALNKTEERLRLMEAKPKDASQRGGHP